MLLSDGCAFLPRSFSSAFPPLFCLMFRSERMLKIFPRFFIEIVTLVDLRFYCTRMEATPSSKSLSKLFPLRFAAVANVCPSSSCQFVVSNCFFLCSVPESVFFASANMHFIHNPCNFHLSFTGHPEFAAQNCRSRRQDQEHSRPFA